MGNEKYFDENVVLYDRYRPTYMPNLYEDIIRYANICESSRILEIGCGTGNATFPFILTGAKVTAVELGAKLSAFTRQRFLDRRNFDIVNNRFEDYQTNEKYDLIFAATSLHWISPEYAYTRCKELLREGGVLAAFWNTPRISRENDELYAQIQSLYAGYMPDSGEEREVLSESKWYKSRCERLNAYFDTYGYRNCVFTLYRGERSFDADAYVGLLHTYSDHMALPQGRRTEFFERIHAVISKHGHIDLIDTVDLHMGQK